eukprot:TRINITY_DN29598_c0_g1_i1.p1 TRINITY_DN29598_c0_g1~~TRINITY_DN29598_c0_g1_i1.p1  ORF type:complete len:208 (-),score=48.08 TRINITY_DN29598_c0_g1_i1:38-661(-)
MCIRDRSMWGARQPKPRLPEASWRQRCYHVTIDCFPHARKCKRPHHLLHRHFDDLIMFCVCVNIVMIATQHRNQSDTWDTVLTVQNLMFLGVFTVEMGMKLAAYGPVGYWRDQWNRFDGMIVVLSWLAQAEASFWPFRLIRALRMLRVAKKVPEIRTLVETILVSLVGVWSIFVLSLIHISEPTRLLSISYAVFCLKKKKKTHITTS